MKTTKLICMVLCAICLISAVFAGCKSTGATPDEISTEGSSYETTVTDITTEADVVASTANEDTTANAETIVTDSTDNNQGNSGNNNNNSNSNTNSNSNNSNNSNSNNNSNNNNSSNSSSSSGSQGNSSASNNKSNLCTVTTGENKLSAKVGSIVTYTYYLKTPKRIENVQATFNYDSSALRLVEADSKDMFPVINSGVVYNTELSNMVKFNASNISGYDFTAKGILVTLKFEVLKKGNTSVSTSIEIMDEKGGNPYVNNGMVVKDIICEELVSQ